jgi:hypothetical protein
MTAQPEASAKSVEENIVIELSAGFGIRASHTLRLSGMTKWRPETQKSSRQRAIQNEFMT